MEPLLLIVSSWWWAVPAAAAVGATTWAGVTAPRRRARRIELDASRRERSLAARAVISARAGVRDAQARVLAARAERPEAMPAARHALQQAKLAEKHAILALRAARAQVRASSAHYHAGSSADPLPIERLRAAHEAILARWMAYETDPERALAYPQMTDPRHPTTIAFLEAQRTASERRPSSARTRLTPDEYLAYRDAVRELEVAFTEAERAAGAAPPAPRPRPWTVAGWRILPPELL